MIKLLAFSALLLCNNMVFSMIRELPANTERLYIDKTQPNGNWYRIQYQNISSLAKTKKSIIKSLETKFSGTPWRFIDQAGMYFILEIAKPQEQVQAMLDQISQ